MLVTIIQSSRPKYWYHNLIGESFYVLTSVNGKHRIDISHYPESEQKFLHGFFIDAEDCLPLKHQEHNNDCIKEETYFFSCVNCDWIFNSAVNKELNCPYCKKNIRTNPFNETDGFCELGTCSII